MMRVFALLLSLFCFGLSVPLGGIALGDIDPGFVNKDGPPRSWSYDRRGREMMPPPPERPGITIGMRAALATQYAEVILQYPLPIAVEWNRWILWSRTLAPESNGSITIPLDWDHLPPAAWDVVLAACANSTLECRLDTPEDKQNREERALFIQSQRLEFMCDACDDLNPENIYCETCYGSRVNAFWDELHVPPKDPWSGLHTVIIRHKRK